MLSFAKSLGIVSIVAPSQHAHNWRGQAGAHDLDMVSVSRLSDFLGFADEPVVDYNDDDSDNEGYLTDYQDPNDSDATEMMEGDQSEGEDGGGGEEDEEGMEG